MTNTYLALHMTEPSGTRLSPEEDRRMLEEWEASGVAEGSMVARAEEAKSVMVRGGKTLVTDGPFPEFKEWFAGYDLVEADSLDEAAAYMAGHPTAPQGRILILPTVAMF